jgi:integrase/recombinase XerD
VAKLNLSGYRNTGEQRTLRFREKGGKDREIPVRHDLEGWINEYLVAAGMLEASKASPFFRSADKTKTLINVRYTDHSIRQMMKRRLADAGLPELFSPHSFRVTVMTDLLTQNVPL